MEGWDYSDSLCDVLCSSFIPGTYAQLRSYIRIWPIAMFRIGFWFGMRHRDSFFDSRGYLHEHEFWGIL